MNISFELDLKNLLIAFVLILIIYYFTFNSCTLCNNKDLNKIKNFIMDLPKKLMNNKEGYSNYTLQGANIDFNMSIGVPGDKWLSIQDKKLEKDNTNMYDDLKDNVAGEVPLPEGQMDFFYNNEFDAKCCFEPNQYSSGNGCACFSEEQVKYLSNRGGNHT